MLVAAGGCSSATPPTSSQTKTVTETVATSNDSPGPPPQTGTTVATSNGSSSPPPQQQTTGNAVAEIGQEARDGNLAFTVESPWHRVNQAAATLTVRNVGSSAATYLAANQKLIDSQGRVFAPDIDLMVTTSVSVPDWGIRAEINPTVQVTRYITFDVPDAVTPKELELHESEYSPGVRVALP
jgi:hypothetical protein